MSIDDEQLWSTFRADASSACVEWLRTRLAQPGLFDLTADELVMAADCSPPEATSVLERAVLAGLLTKRVAFTCPCCSEELSLKELAARTNTCAHCSRAFADCGSGPKRRVHYTREGDPGRSVPWVLVLHGMNTRASWQEELSWLISTTYGRSVPVFIYKYGRVRTGVLLGWRRRSLTRNLSHRIQLLAGAREGDRLGSRPDVIAHSFGTWMLGHALASTDPEVADLAVGRIVLLGSILRPSFNWPDILARGRAEAVINHYGTNDHWARLAGYVIYDAGPSGRRGFDPIAGGGDNQVVNRQEPGFGHSSFFQIAHMTSAYLDSWKPFLTLPSSGLSALKRSPRGRPWRSPPRPLRFATALLALTLGVAAAALTATAIVLGLIQLLSAAVE